MHHNENIDVPTFLSGESVVAGSWHVPCITRNWKQVSANETKVQTDNKAQQLDAEVIVHGDGVAFAQEIFAGSHKLAADEPVSSGGTGSGPGPYEFLLAALGSCTSITVTMYARRKAWPLREVTVWLRHSKVHASDCADCDSREAIIDRITRGLRFGGPLTDEQRQRLLEIANKCPVQGTLTSKVNITTRLV